MKVLTAWVPEGQEGQCLPIASAIYFSRAGVTLCKTAQAMMISQVLSAGINLRLFRQPRFQERQRKTSEFIRPWLKTLSASAADSW